MRGKLGPGEEQWEAGLMMTTNGLLRGGQVNTGPGPADLAMFDHADQLLVKESIC